ncbi:MAG: beta-galactosidase, partial [Candidatus Heimdallarchaeota archaeon]
MLKKEGGLNVISTYVPWIFHEVYEGQFDFDGETHPRRNLHKFLKICRKLKLPVIFRPGPFIYSEYPGFGIPLWIGELYPEVVVRTADGGLERSEHFFNVSLNHPTYLELVKNWYTHLRDEFEVYFENPIILFQLDNETGLMYNFNVGRIDFNEYTVKAFHEWLEKEFGNPQTLSVYCVESYLSFEEVLPPKDGLNVAKSMIWQSFFEDWIVRYLENLRDLAHDLDIPLVFAITEQSSYFNPSNPIKKAPIV